MRALILGVAAVAACDLGNEAQPDAVLSDADYREPRADLVPAVGGVDSLELATWNIENFPARASTPAIVADLITSLGLDVVVTQEIANENAWHELVARLPDHEAVLSTHRYSTGDYQKLGVIYRASEIAVGDLTLLFGNDGNAFPRPAISLPITELATGRTLELIGVHLKAGVDASDAARRTDAIVALDAHVQAQVATAGEADVVILGDYNEVVTDATGQAVLAPLLDHPERYTVHSAPLGQAGTVSFLPANIMLDQLTSTVALADRLAGATTVVPPLDAQYPGYEAEVSDHLPVVLIAPR